MKTPIHLWIIGVLSLLWNAGGAVDYVMIKSANEQYLSQLSLEQLSYFDAFPFWVNFLWALGVWGAIAGSVLLLMRSRFALWAFVLSFVSMAGNLVWGFLLSPTSMVELMGPTGTYFSAAIVIIAIFLIFYTNRMLARGVLR